MVCLGSCLFAFALLGGSLIYVFPNKGDKSAIQFMNILSDDKKQIYQNIAMERFKIYTIGGLFGILLAFLYLWILKNKKTPWFHNDSMKICSFVAIILATQVIFYLLYPKSDYMIYHLTSKEEVDAWMNTYLAMKCTWYTGLAIGVIAYILFAYSYLH